MSRFWTAVATAATVVTLAGGAAAAPPETASPAPTPGEAQAVRQVVDAFVESLNTADIDAFSALFAPEATVFFPLSPVAGLLEGKAEIVKVFSIFFESVRSSGKGPRYMELTPEDLKIQLFGDTAVATFHFSGRTMYSRRTLVLHRAGGKWLIVHMHGSGLPIKE
jgi:uncharacterized protein (TIGR02246 family)